jgi:hypothetical protein
MTMMNQRLILGSNGWLIHWKLTATRVVTIVTEGKASLIGNLIFIRKVDLIGKINATLPINPKYYTLTIVQIAEAFGGGLPGGGLFGFVSG